MRYPVGLVILGMLVGSAQAFAETATAVIAGTADNSPISGTATLTDTAEGLAVDLHIANAPPGQHGLHFHEHGSCADGGQAAGGHYNPGGAKHGLLPRDGFAGAHAGDLGNMEIGLDGSGTLALTLPGLIVTGDYGYPVVDHAIILHEKPDDFGQPTGNAGGRIACGGIEVAKP